MRGLLSGLIVCWLGLAGVASGQPVDAAKVLVIVEVSPQFRGPQGEAAVLGIEGTPEVARDHFIDALEWNRGGHRPLGGLEPVISQQAQDPQAQAERAACDLILHVQILNRQTTLGGSANYRLEVDAAVYSRHAPVRGKPAKAAAGGGAGSWKKDWSDRLTTEGFSNPAGTISDCERMTQELGAVLIARRLPYKVLGGGMSGVRFTITNPTDRLVSNLRLAVPFGNKYGPEMWYTQESLAAGETRTITFTRGEGRLPGARYDFRAAYLAEVEFAASQPAAAPDEPAAPPAGDGGKLKRDDVKHTKKASR